MKWQTVRRITNEVLGVKGLTRLYIEIMSEINFVKKVVVFIEVNNNKS